MSEIIYSTDGLQEGAVVAYPGVLKASGGIRESRHDRDWLRITRLNGEGIHGLRVHPLDWERDIEFVVVAQQIRSEGLLLAKVLA